MSTPTSSRKIFAYKDNLALPEGGSKQEQSKQEKSKPKQPKPPRTAFICFADAKREKLLEQHGLPKRKKDILNLAAAEWKKLNEKERADWDEVSRKDKLRFVREKDAYKGEWKIPKKRAKKHPSAPKRPMSAFLKYSRVKRAEIKKENPDMQNTDISRLLGEFWNNACESEKSYYEEAEKKERAKYNEVIKEWREKQAKKDAASRTSHHFMIQQTQQPIYRETGSFDPFMRVHSVEEAVQKVDHGFAGFPIEDYAPNLPRRPQPDESKTYGRPYASMRPQANEVPYRPRQFGPPPGHYGYPFRPYSAPRATTPMTFPEPHDDPRMEDEDQQYQATSRYFDRPRHSPYGFYQYP